MPLIRCTLRLRKNTPVTAVIAVYVRKDRASPTTPVMKKVHLAGRRVTATNTVFSATFLIPGVRPGSYNPHFIRWLCTDAGGRIIADQLTRP